MFYQIRMIRRYKNEGGPLDEEAVRIGAGLGEAVLSSFTILSQIGPRSIAADFFQI